MSSVCFVCMPSTVCKVGLIFFGTVKLATRLFLDGDDDGSNKHENPIEIVPKETLQSTATDLLDYCIDDEDCVFV